MRNKACILGLTLLLLFSSFFPITNGSNIKSLKKEQTLNLFYTYRTYYVGGNGPDNYTKIQDAIDDASDGDTVFVYQMSSPYYENLVVDKVIELVGENKTYTCLDGEYGDYVIHVNVDNVKIKNFNICNSGGFKGNCGIRIDSKNCIISNCDIFRTKTGILFNGTTSNEVDRCVLHTNGRGIYIKSSKLINIKDSYFSHSSLGLDIQESDNIKISGDYVTTNSYGLFIFKSSNIEITKSAVYDNNDNQGGILLNNCNDVKIKNCNIYHNGKGVAIIDCANIDILNSNINTNTHTAINLYKNNQGILVQDCVIANNLNFAFNVLSNNTGKFRGNNIYNSVFGLHSKSAKIDARRNWWGSLFGPALFDRKIKDRMFFFRGWVRFFPWLVFKNRRAGSNWQIDKDLFKVDINSSRFVEIELPGIDSDDDLIPDWWEEKWNYDPNIWNDHMNLDPDEDALSNVEECYTDKYGSNPYKKDVFLEIDWVEETDPSKPNRPSSQYIEQMIMRFNNHSINLHIDVGNLDGGEEIPFVSNFTNSDLLDFYWDYFLHNDLNNPRKGIFHYALICDFGLFGGFSFMGWDSFDSFQIAIGKLNSVFSDYQRDWLIITTILHELGHTLGLTVDDHRGIDNNVAGVTFTHQWWKFRNYKSSLNYYYVYEILDYSDGSNGKGDFNDWENLDFGFFKNTHFILPKEIKNY